MINGEFDHRFELPEGDTQGKDSAEWYNNSRIFP